jgi:hypothetical protein
MSIDPNEFLTATGVPSAKFPEIGATVKGVVQHLEVGQQRDFTSGELKTWDDGKPMMQLVVTLATDEHDPTVDNDDGSRRLFVKGQMLQAIRGAVRGANSQLLVGGTLVVKYVADKPAERKGMNPAKQYEAAYKPPVAGQQAANDLLGAAAGPAPSASDLL